jgi:hypothetical protein
VYVKFYILFIQDKFQGMPNMFKKNLVYIYIYINIYILFIQDKLQDIPNMFKKNEDDEYYQVLLMCC